MTSIEWLIDQLEQKGDMRETPSIRNLQLNIDTSDYLELKRQAKEMHKQEIIDAYGDGLNAHRTDFCNRDEYFAKTYGSNGSDDHISDISKMVEVPQQEKCISCDEQKETHKICMDCIGKMIKENQQEISDEEIEKAARDYNNSVIYGPTLLHFEQGAFWYREQLKSILCNYDNTK